MKDSAMCNLYNVTTNQEAIRQIFADLHDRAGNVAPGQVYPDQLAPIVRHAEYGIELVKARWGLPSPPSVLKTALGRENRCLVPLTSFAEPRGKGMGNQWFAPADGRLIFFAGIEVRGWRSVRKVKDGETVDDLFAFMTAEPNAEVGAVHPKAMPAILTEPDEWQAWLEGIPARELQRPLRDGTLTLIDNPT
jgi:putative SOS response-associated peptidase YedK